MLFRSFLDTLDNIVKGLNKAGFSDKDFKLADPAQILEIKREDPLKQLTIFPSSQEIPEDITSDIDTSRISVPSDENAPDNPVSEIEQSAIRQTEAFEKTVSEIESKNLPILPNEIQQLVKTYEIKEIFKEQAAQIILPQFFLKVPANDLFGKREEEWPLEKENLLEGFALGKSDTNIAFDSITSELYKVDLDETAKEHTPTFVRLDGEVKDSLVSYIMDPSRKDGRVKTTAKFIMEVIGNMYPIPDKEIERYIHRVLEDFTDEQFADFYNQKYTYTDKIKLKIRMLSDVFAEQKFKDFLDTDKVFIKPSYTLPDSISPVETSKNITKSLYEKEGSMNGYEERVINEIGNMPNIAFWTRNIERRGFRINGFINHYPDFIIQTKSGKIILLETKGDHLDAEQKIKLGELWKSKAGNNFRYFMVYERRTVDGAYKLEEFLGIVKNI